jgi:NAD(P)H-nitrite reductase large subunit
LAVAAQIIHAGGEVAGVLEASIFKPDHLRFLPAMWGQWSKVREGWDYWRVLRKAKVPLTRGRAAISARGQTQVEKVVTARLDHEMNPVPGTEQTVAADTLVLGYGFLPSNDLTRLLGCRHQFIPEQMHYTPKRDAMMRTSVPCVYAVGDSAGVGGEKLARIEGRVAGLAVAGRLERMKPTHIHEAMGRLRKDLYREQRFAGMLARLFGVRPGMLSWAKDDTLICRCEEITKKEIMEALEVGCESPTWVKRMTRAGMGMCQGRVCGNWIAWLTAHTLEQDPADVLLDTVRPPLRPIPMNFSEVSDNG